MVPSGGIGVEWEKERYEMVVGCPWIPEITYTTYLYLPPPLTMKEI